jgi:nucleotide-binding universal stress UspA family protein
MFMNVLVGIDGSASSRDAIALASRLLRRGGRLTLVHVRSPARSGVAGPLGGGADDAREASRRLLVRERASAEVATELVSVCDSAPGRGLQFAGRRARGRSARVRAAAGRNR